jgi:hypothetical protein
MKIHTDAQCETKLQGIKILAERIQVEIREKGCTFSIAESIVVMCDELLREFPSDKES